MNSTQLSEDRLKNLTAFLKSQDASYLALTPTEIFYLTNRDIEGIQLYITKDYPAKPIIAFSSPMTAWQTEELFSNVPGTRIIIYEVKSNFGKEFADIIKQNPTRKIYISNALACSVKTLVSSRLKDISSSVIIEETSVIADIRETKTLEEIKIIKENQQFTRYAVEKLARQYIKNAISRRKKITERSVKIKILEYFASIDAGPAFEPIVAFGRNTCHPHYITGDTRLNPDGDIVMIDAGCRRKNYNSDLTRTFLLGKIKPGVREVYQIVKDAQKSAISVVRAGAECATVDAAARRLIETKGFGGCFIHGVGHGLGFEIHESPAINKFSFKKLKENSVVTVEPGIYLKGEFGVRIEDTVVVDKTGCSIL